MKFTSKLRRVGSSWGILIPRECLNGYFLGDNVEFEIPDRKVETPQVIINRLFGNENTQTGGGVPQDNRESQGGNEQIQEGNNVREQLQS